MHSKILKGISIFFFWTIVCGFISVYLGKELNYDLANYHYYNPFSFLHQRNEIDFWPIAFIQVHFTPTFDFISFFLINHFTPKFAMFWMGAIHGINFLLVFCIAKIFLSSYTTIRYVNILAMALAFLGLYGPAVWPNIGSFQNDNVVSIFVLTYIFLQLKAFATSQRYVYHLLGGFVLGLGVGGKLTAGVFAGGALIALMSLPFSFGERAKLVFFFALSVAVGMLISSGYWMLFLWQKYHNPVFPLFNAFFHSPDFPYGNWRDIRFLPKTWWQTFFYPFIFSFDGHTADSPFRDFRFAFVYCLFVLYAFVFICKKNQNKKVDPLPIAMRWFFYFFIASYFLWQTYFSIMRYLVPLEMLAPLLICLLFSRLLNNSKTTITATTFAIIALAITMKPTLRYRNPDYSVNKDYFNVKLPDFVNIAKEGTVLIPINASAKYVDPMPENYLIPFFPQRFRFIGIQFNHYNYTLSDKIKNQLMHLQEKNLYLLASPDLMTKMREIANSIGYYNQKKCDYITSDIQQYNKEIVLLCQYTT